MDKALIRDSDGVKVNVVSLSDDWTGMEGEWQVPVGHHLDGDTTFNPPSPPKPSPPKPTVITYEAFQDRFTAAEFNAATDFVFESDLVTGKPKRRALIQGLSRAMAKNAVDLNDARTVAFMDALVAGGIITAARKDAILTP